jgi:hypothetical protein
MMEFFMPHMISALRASKGRSIYGSPGAGRSTAGLRGANVRVEKRLDGSMAVRQRQTDLPPQFNLIVTNDVNENRLSRPD